MTVQKTTSTPQVPKNPKLWEQLVAQARIRFHPFPSLPASRWVHREYVRRGGTFVMKHKENDRHDKSGHLTARGKREEKEAAKEKEKTAPKKKRGR